MKRRAPKGGYLFDDKDTYRKVIWQEFAKAVNPRTANVLMMPSIEGREIEVAERCGFRRDRIYVVDMNPAIIVSLRARYPGLPTVKGAHGVTVGLACERLAEAGVKIRAMNLDFTACAGAPMVSELDVVMRSGAMMVGGTSVLAVTQLRGRETGRWGGEGEGFV